jgi:hypothetical protein
MTRAGSSSIRGDLWLALPAFLLCLSDQIVTLAGQPHVYWRGDYRAPMEGAPHGHWLLSQHPAWYIAAACGYLLFIVVFICLLPRILARMASAAFVIGHTWGTCWWLQTFYPPDRGSIGYWLCFATFIVSGILLGLSFEMSERSRKVGDPPA